MEETKQQFPTEEVTLPSKGLYNNQYNKHNKNNQQKVSFQLKR